MRGVVLVMAVLVSLRAAAEEPRLVLAAATSPRMAGELEYEGTYLYAGDDAERRAIKGAVDRATEGMFGKVIARDELMKRSEIRPSYTIHLEAPGTVCVETPGFPSERSPLDGSEVELRTKYGDVVKNSQQFVGGALVQRGRTDDGSGSTEFRLQDDGKTLLVTRVSRSPRLPRVVEYTLTYRRQEAAH
jgi:hypothetical protein